MSRGKHCRQWRLLDYPLKYYKAWAMNRWYAYIKPDIKRRINKCLELLKK